MARLRSVQLNLQSALDGIRADRAIVVNQVLDHGMSLQFAAEELRNDSDVVGEAVCENPHALQSASETLRAHVELMALAAWKDLDSLMHAAPGLQFTSVFVRDLIRHIKEFDREDCEKTYLEEELRDAVRAIRARDRRIGSEQVARLPISLFYSEYEVNMVPQYSPFAEALSGLMVETVVRHREHYRSYDYRPAPQLEVIVVRSVQNRRLLHMYVAKRDQLQFFRGHNCGDIPCFSHLKLPVGQHDVDLNEHLMFHGALPEALESICQGGFNPRRSGKTTRNLFGLATYFAANSSKADDYTEQRANPLQKGARRTMIIARVALGKAYRTTNPMPDVQRPPNGDDGLEFDSVWADTSANGGCVDHVEAMVYDGGQALPVALIDYQHASSCPCAFCHRRPA